MPKQRAVRLFLDNTFEENKYPIDANQIVVSKDDKYQFEPACVFTERKPKRAFWRGERKLLFLGDGLTHAYRFEKGNDKLQLTWTKKEATAHVKKEVAKAHAELKPIKTWQFIAILAFELLITLLLVRLAMLWGAFG